MTSSEKIKNIIDRSLLFTHESMKINSEFPVGYRDYLKKYSGQYIVGRERNIVLPKENHINCYFALVDLNSIIASHNEITFKNSDNYPLLDGLNVNDRNYEGDKNAQLAVMQIAENLNPDVIISTSATSSGTPIVSIDGIVVSGNNRVMSLKLSSDETYFRYKTVLFNELNAGGYFEKFLLLSLDLNDAWEFIAETSSFDDPKRIRIEKPVLVRIDPNIRGYSKEVLNIFNVSRGKSERPIDMASRISQQLIDRKECSNKLLNLIDDLESPSDLFYSNDLIKKYKQIILECNLVSERELPKHFNDSGITDDGKIFYRRLLLSLILSPKNVEISENAGMKSYRNILENSIIILSKIKLIDKVLIEDIDDAFILINKMNAVKMSAHEYLTSLSLFDESINIRAAILIDLMNSLNTKQFKEALDKYYKSLDSNKDGPGMFPDDFLNESEIFEKTLAVKSSEKMKDSINKIGGKEQVSLDTLNETDQLIAILEADMNSMFSGNKTIYLKAIEELKKQND